MNMFGLMLPQWLLDWSGSVLVVISLFYLFKKHGTYWHFSNASVVPYFVLFMVTKQYMLAGLQISYLIFGLHGMYLWWLEQRRDQQGVRFNEAFWYNLGWILTLVIFAYTVYATNFSGFIAWLQFVIVSLSLLANWATTRKWTWSWYVWMLVNVLQMVFFYNLQLWGLFVLQFVLFAMSIKGLMTWQADQKQVMASGL